MSENNPVALIPSAAYTHNFSNKRKKNLQIIEFLVQSSHTAHYSENTVITLALMYCLCYLYHPLHASAHAPKSTSAKTSHAPLAQSILSIGRCSKRGTSLGISTFAHATGLWVCQLSRNANLTGNCVALSSK